MSPGKICFQTEEEIQKMRFATMHELDFPSLNEIDGTSRNMFLNISVLFENQLVGYSLKDYKPLPRSSLDFTNLWKTAVYEPLPGTPVFADLDKQEAISIHPLLEDRIFVVILPDYIQIVSLLYKRKVVQRFVGFTDITTCIAINLQPTSRSLLNYLSLIYF